MKYSVDKNGIKGTLYTVFLWPETNQGMKLLDGYKDYFSLVIGRDRPSWALLLEPLYNFSCENNNKIA
ncbi:hypothetical protein HMPREF3201_00950 [Megasphaera sp. MJR8396C]|nr:hypothetical protein HMPREF3201_00950 [Megasphaera sp. MJR8396C]